MRRLAGIGAVAWCLSSVHASAQTKPTSLATLFEDIYGPNGLVLSSDDVTLDGTTHAAHFNSAFQSDFRLVNIALTGQLTAIPLPSPASGFTYQFDAATGTFVRSTRSFGPILSDRAETIGQGRLAFGFSNQFFSFDHLDGASLAVIPAVFRHDSFELGGGRADVGQAAEVHDRDPVRQRRSGELRPKRRHEVCPGAIGHEPRAPRDPDRPGAAELLGGRSSVEHGHRGEVTRPREVAEDRPDTEPPSRRI